MVTSKTKALILFCNSALLPPCRNVYETGLKLVDLNGRPGASPGGGIQIFFKNKI